MLVILLTTIQMTLLQPLFNLQEYFFSRNGRPFFRTSAPTAEGDYTYSIPDKQEIWKTLKEMSRNASPGRDGFNVAFYLVAWNWFVDDVVKVVRDFMNLV